VYHLPNQTKRIGKERSSSFSFNHKKINKKKGKISIFPSSAELDKGEGKSRGKDKRKEISCFRSAKVKERKKDKLIFVCVAHAGKTEKKKKKRKKVAHVTSIHFADSDRADKEGRKKRSLDHNL